MIPDDWPRWIIIFIGFALIIATILLGLILEPAAQAVAPQPDPTPTHIHLAYAAPLSGECIDCHMDVERLMSMVESEEDIQPLLITAADMASTHGRLGCVTCHRGNGTTDNADAAHEDLVVDPSLHFIEECDLCHRDLADVIPEDRLRTPHNEAAHGLAVDVTCSDCHGAVGHGFDPVSGEIICSMTICLECHEERNLETQLEDCNVCHIGPHDIVLTCGDCHLSTERWNETQLAVHPVELVGWHAEIDCYECHDWPDFGGLTYVCNDCHNRPHDFGDNNCESCHTPDGWSE